ncbi:hypothetical protein ZIOFF_071800 [Zingiber officinale]|uniref:Uncharacterized protein n=1 Tax=Zingiber officinale TaxID=94328 RepID=A0A8J5C206_ZINOF|nr:hypothetical protein ZIOFF_071800 [Zingiber officinale]
MDQEIVPIKFYRGINSYWRSRRYQKLESSAPGKRAMSTRLGGAGGSGRWITRLRRRIGKTRFRVRIPSPVKIVARIRDAYVEWMLSAAGKAPAALSGSDAWTKRIPKSGPAKTSSSAFERRLMFEIYNSLVVAGEIRSK